jgi:hypothetical protein
MPERVLDATSSVTARVWSKSDGAFKCSWGSGSYFCGKGRLEPSTRPGHSHQSRRWQSQTVRVAESLVVVVAAASKVVSPGSGVALAGAATGGGDCACIATGREWRCLWRVCCYRVRQSHALLCWRRQHRLQLLRLQPRPAA